MSARGIDYGMGATNIDKTTGIRFGVISSNEVCQAWSDDSEAEYGEPSCPKCRNEAKDSTHIDTEDFEQLYSHGCDEYACENCKLTLDSSDVYGESPLGFTYSADGYEASQSGDDCDIFITKSPFYTRAQFCSPCAPGACYLMNSCDNGERAYCFGHDWFENNKAPYRVWRVSDDTEVLPS
jgi:hypothetical protein